MPHSQRSFAVSLQWLVIRLTGTIPGPVILGTLIDRSCVFWKRLCSEDSRSCYLYNNDTLSGSFLGFSVISKLITTLGFSLALCLYRVSPDVSDEDEDNAPPPPADSTPAPEPETTPTEATADQTPEHSTTAEDGQR